MKNILTNILLTNLKIKIMITVTNEMKCGRVECATGNMKVTGEFKIDADNKVYRVDSGMVNDLKGNNLGSFNVYHSGKDLKVNLNDMSTDVAGVAATAIGSAITELEQKYNV